MTNRVRVVLHIRWIALANAEGIRVVRYSMQGNPLHLIVEAADARAGLA